jgi:hypothetical protein
MKKKVEKMSEQGDLFALVAFLFAIFYNQSVLTVAHHASMRLHDGSGQSVESPTVACLTISLILVAVSWRKKNMKLSYLNVITLTVLTMASLFWVSGLRANFFF